MLYRVLTYGQKQAANTGPFGRILGLGVGYSKRIHGREIAGMVYNQENRHMGRGTVNGVYFGQRSTLTVV